LIKIILLVAILTLPLAIAAFPGISSEYHGIVITEGSYAAPGTLILASFIDGRLCGETKVRLSGEYSSLSCTGGRPGEQVFFRVNYDKALESAAFIPGNATRVDLFVGELSKANKLLEETPWHGKCSSCIIGFALIGIGLILVANGIYFAFKWKKN